MRLLLLSCLLLLAAITAAQTNSLFNTVRTDVIIAVRRHSMGADLVDITMRDPDYPVDLLKTQIAKMCRSFDAPPRGLMAALVPLSDPKQKAVKASFATNGIMDPESGIYKIEPMLKAFAGVAAPHTVTGFTIEFQGVVPTKITLSKYTLPGVVTGEARFTNDPPLKGIEYRIKLLTQDPAQITFPDKIEPGKPPSAQPVSTSDNRRTIIVLVCLAGLAAGALVYFAMLRIGSRTRP